MYIRREQLVSRANELFVDAYLKKMLKDRHINRCADSYSNSLHNGW